MHVLKKGIVGLLAIGLCLGALTSCSFQKTKSPLDDLVEVKKNQYTCSFDGIRHDFIVDLPEETKGAPLVLMLHGYGGDAESFRRDIKFQNDANELGYAVCYVTGAQNSGDATSSTGWNSGIGNSDNKDVEFLCALVSFLEDTYGFDQKKTYVVGFSNGAFMTHRLAMEASDTFEAAVAVAGMMSEYVWNHKQETNSISFFEVYGEKDDVVPKYSDGTASHSKAPAIEDVMDYYVSVNNLQETSEKNVGNESLLMKYFSKNTKKQVWILYIPDGRHAWPNEKYSGIQMNQLILEFLESQN